jgi:signal transduction histidine kinase
MRSPSLEAQVLRNILRAELASNRVGEAERTARAAMVAAEKAGEASNPEMFAALAQLAFQQGRIRAAVSSIDRAFAGADLSTTPMPARDAHLTAFRVYKAVGNTPKALAHLEAVKRLDDEATKLATQASTALMGARFDFANQELRIARLKADELRTAIRAQRERARTLRWTFGLLGAAATVLLAMLTVGLFTIRRSRNAVRAANADLAVTNGALEKALAAKTEFLATTSHEIRTPLNGILGMTEVMLTDRALPDQARERIRLVHGAGTTMRALVDDILDVAKIEKGQLSLENAPFDLAAVLRDAAMLWEDQIRAKGVVFDLSIDLPAGPVLGDAARVRQIVFNLLSNATKFTATGAIALRAARGDDGLHRIVVSDTGIGIPPDKIDAVFESFRQADASTTRRFGGTGLGLSISRNLARAMGGELDVESVPGSGSIFTFSVALPPHATEGSPDAAAGDLVLVADRNPIMRATLRNLLGGHAESVVAVGSLAELMIMLHAETPRAVLIDDAVLSADAGEDVLSALRDRIRETGASFTVLKSRGSSVPALDAAVVVEKPVAGPALIATMFSHERSRGDGAVLVSRAA